MSGNADITGTSYVGGIVGDKESNAIENCNAKGNIQATGDYVGGLIGQLGCSYISVNNCITESNVTGMDRVGGLIGQSNAPITNSNSKNGKITGNNYVGGIVGVHENPITSCYTTVDVVGNSYVGGLCGFNRSTTISQINTTGIITGASSYIGGLCGSIEGAVTIKKSFTIGEVTGLNSVGGLVGYSGFWK